MEGACRVHTGIASFFFFFFNEQVITSLMFVTFYNEVKLSGVLTFSLHVSSLCAQRPEAKHR